MKVELGKNIIHFNELNSTNEFAINFIKNNKINSPIIITTYFQVNGAGQREKIWESEQGKNLLMSVILSPNISLKDQFNLTILSALAISDLLNEYKLKNVKIKWPNDILINDKKIAGILIQNKVKSDKISHSVIGIGLNINQMVFKDYLPKATSILSEISEEMNLEKVRDILISFMEKRYNEIINGKNLMEEYQKNLYLKNQKSLFQINERKVFGIIKSVTSSGKLVVDIDEVGEKYFSLNEIKFLF